MRIVITSNPILLNVLRGVVRYRAHGFGFPEADEEARTLVVNEAAANVICHTYQNHPDARLALEVREVHGGMELYLEDSDPKVPSEAMRPRALEEIRLGGPCIHFINEVMDSAVYDPEFSGGNQL